VCRCGGFYKRLSITHRAHHLKVSLEQLHQMFEHGRVIISYQNAYVGHKTSFLS
jgi:hypothetical protein